MQFNHLTQKEREQISQLKSSKHSLRYIAVILQRNVSTISREVRRNISNDSNYWAIDADFKSETRKEIPRRRRKLDSNLKLLEYVSEKLRNKWSPNQIAKRITYEYPLDTTMRISHESIYTYLYLRPRGELKRELIACLRRERLERRKRTNTYKSRIGIQDAVSIHERPENIQERTIPGHWEGDLIVGKEHKSYMGTLVERTTRTVIRVPLKTKNTSEVRRAFAKELSTLPQQMKLSLTYDRGTEMAQHKLFTKNTKMSVYFADPHSPWQRGSNENTNGLLRQYFPKGTDLSTYSRAAIKAVQHELNERPRKVLDYRTPKEVFDTLLESVAIRT